MGERSHYPLLRPRIRRNGVLGGWWTLEVPGQWQRTYHRTWHDAMFAAATWNRKNAWRRTR